MVGPLALPAARTGMAIATSPAARAAVAPAIRTISGVTRDVSTKVARTQLVKGITFGSLATMAVDAVTDLFLDDPDETSNSLRRALTENGSDLAEHEADAIIDTINAIEDAKRAAQDLQPDGSTIKGFTLPTEEDEDRLRAINDYESLREVFNKQQIRALALIAQLANLSNGDDLITYLERNYDES